MAILLHHATLWLVAAIDIDVHRRRHLNLGLGHTHPWVVWLIRNELHLYVLVNSMATPISFLRRLTALALDFFNEMVLRPRNFIHVNVDWRDLWHKVFPRYNNRCRRPHHLRQSVGLERVTAL